MKVRRNNRDWTATCADHNNTTWCGDWMSAMEAAWGHIAMHHERPPLRLVIPEPGGRLDDWDPANFLLWNAGIE